MDGANTKRIALAGSIGPLDSMGLPPLHDDPSLAVQKIVAQLGVETFAGPVLPWAAGLDEPGWAPTAAIRLLQTMRMVGEGRLRSMVDCPAGGSPARFIGWRFGVFVA